MKCPHCKGTGNIAPKDYSPTELLARDLARKQGSSLPFCRKAVAALLEAGETVERLRGRLGETEPGEGPWNWAQSVRKPKGGNGAPYGIDRVSGAATEPTDDRFGAALRRKSGG